MSPVTLMTHPHLLSLLLSLNKALKSYLPMALGIFAHNNGQRCSSLWVTYPNCIIFEETKKEEICVSSFFESIRLPYICQYKFDFFSSLSMSSSVHRLTSWGLDWNSKSPGSWSMPIFVFFSGEAASIVAVAQ